MEKVFSRKMPAGDGAVRPDSAGSSPREKILRDEGRAVITDQVELKGSLAFEGTLEFHGMFEGEMISGDTLWIGPQAVLKCDIQANKVVLHGKMHGNINASDSVEVCDQAQLFGNVRAGKFIVAEGAIFRGRSEPLERQAASPEFLPTFRHLIPKLA